MVLFSQGKEIAVQWQLSLLKGKSAIFQTKHTYLTHLMLRTLYPRLKASNRLRTGAFLGIMAVSGAVSAQYCIPTTDCSIGDQISLMQLSNITNPSGCGVGGYQDFTSQTINLNANQAYTMNLSFGFSDQAVGVYADFNNDFDFDDPGEFLAGFPPNGTSNLSGSITVPSTVPSGTYRMRVRCEYFGAFSAGGACLGSTFTYGETEDYTISVSNNPCTSPPTAGTANGPSLACANTNFTVNVQGNTSGNGQTYQWQSSPNGTAWNDIVGQTSLNLTTSLTAATHYRCVVTCSGQSDTTNGHFVGLTPSNICTICQTSTATSSAYGYIQSFNFNGVIFNSQIGCQQYTNNTGTPINIIRGQSANIIVNVQGCSGGNFGHQTKVFVDLNANGQFDLPTEEFLLTPPNPTGYGLYTGTVSIPTTAVVGPTMMRVVTVETTSPAAVTPCGSYTWGETEDYILNILPLPANDAGVETFISPSQGACQISPAVIVRVQNLGTTTLNSVDVSLSINGGPAAVTNWTGAIGAGGIGNVNLGQHTINDGDVLKVWTSNPNGVQDSVSFNDTLQTTIYAAMQGAYTVGGTTPDFATVSDAAQAVISRGACADVFLNIRSGTYTESIALLPYTGASNSARVHFQSEAGHPDSVRIESPGSSLSNYTFWFNGGDYYVLDQITLAHTVPNFSILAEFSGEASYNIIRNSKLLGDSAAFSDDFNRIAIRSTTDKDQSNQLLNNEIIGGSRAISVGGPSDTDPEMGWTIRGNHLRGFYFLGIGSFYQINPIIEGNTIEATSSNTNTFRMYVNTAYNGGSVRYNNIYGNSAGFGINIDNVKGTQNSPFVVASNFVFMGDSSTATNNFGLYVQNGSNLVHVLHNSLSVHGATANTAAINVQNGPNVDIVLHNNNVAHYGGGRALSIESGFSVLQSDANNFYAANNDAVRFAGTGYANAAALNSATGLDANSMTVDPMFLTEDMHTCMADFDNKGMAMGETMDIDGDTRNANTPDIGADEFIREETFSLGPDTTICPGNTVVLGNENIVDGTWLWNPTFDTTAHISVSAAGEYNVVAVTSCGTAQDTLEIFHIPAPTASFDTTASFLTYVFTNTSGNTGLNGISYHWDFGDGDTSVLENPVHIYNQAGSYTVTLTVTNACGTSTTATMTLDVMLTGLDGLDQNSWNVYPNPTEGQTRVDGYSELPANLQLKLTDLSGRVVWEANVGQVKGAFSYALNVSDLAVGSYILHMHLGEKLGAKKLIKQ